MGSWKTEMKRRIAIVARTALGLLALLTIGFIALLGVFIWSTAGPDPETVLAKAQPDVVKFAMALERHHRKYGCYPRDLSELVKRGFLSEIPELPSHWGTSEKCGPTFEANVSWDFFRLSFGYVVEGGMGPGDTCSRVYVADDPKGWETTGRPQSMENLVAERILASYRKQHDGKSLDLFMSDVIGKADCDYLYHDRVVRWLGEGTEIDLPPDMFGAGKKGYAYQARDDSSRRTTGFHC